MKRTIFVVFLVSTVFSAAFATPSTTFWSPCVFDIQPYKVFHLGIDNYTTIGKKSGQAFPTDYGLTVGVLPYQKVRMEVGVDMVEPTDYPVYFNAKIGIPESRALPAFNAGIFNAGTKNGITDYNILDIIEGKTLPFNAGRVHVGYYTGNENLLRDSNGNVANKGYMLGYDKYLYKDKVMFAADYASGKNAIGGGGFGLYYFFTRDISLLIGPVWFNDSGINGDAKWTSQLDVNFP